MKLAGVLKLYVTASYAEPGRFAYVQYYSWILMWGDPVGLATKGDTLDNGKDNSREDNPWYPSQGPGRLPNTGGMTDAPGMRFRDKPAAGEDPAKHAESVISGLAKHTKTNIPSDAAWILFMSTFTIYRVNLDTHQVVEEWHYYYGIEVTRDPPTVTFTPGAPVKVR